jgi:GNAT superfamily N-acetyltransferase
VVEFATFVAVVDGRDVGVARGASLRSSDMRELISMWVAPSARRQGIGRQLIDSVAAWAKAAGAAAVVLDVGGERVGPVTCAPWCMQLGAANKSRRGV